MALKLGVMPVVTGRGTADPVAVADFVHLIEELGCESLWTIEHVVIPDSYRSVYPYDPSGTMSLVPGDDVPDPLHWLTFAAAHSTRLKLGTAMLILPLHNPLVLATRLATVDALSGGRLLAGVGVGWLKEEYEAVGVPFADRGRRADEYLGALKALLTQWPASFAGEYVRFDGVHIEPRPHGVPIVIGGHAPAAVRRAARYGDGLYPLGVNLDGLRGLIERLRAECAVLGRDPAEIELTARAPGSAATVRALSELGVSRVVMRVPLGDLDRARAEVTRYQGEVLA
jgi:probable F420-dependent oxidoreductase